MRLRLSDGQSFDDGDDGNDGIGVGVGGVTGIDEGGGRGGSSTPCSFTRFDDHTLPHRTHPMVVSLDLVLVETGNGSKSKVPIHTQHYDG